MKKILSKLLLGMCIILFTACGTPKSQKAFEKFFKDVQTVNVPNLEISEEIDIFKEIAKKANYKIISISEKENFSEIDVNIKAVNIPAYMGEYMQFIMPLAFSGANEETMKSSVFKFFSDLSKRKDLIYTDTTLKVYLYKENDEWQIDNFNDVISAILGGMDKMYEEFQADFDWEE